MIGVAAAGCALIAVGCLVWSWGYMQEIDRAQEWEAEVDEALEIAADVDTPIAVRLELEWLARVNTVADLGWGQR